MKTKDKISPQEFVDAKIDYISILVNKLKESCPKIVIQIQIQPHLPKGYVVNIDLNSLEE